MKPVAARTIITFITTIDSSSLSLRRAELTQLIQVLTQTTSKRISNLHLNPKIAKPIKVLNLFEEIMAAVVNKFFVASMFMWVVPLVILYGFNNNLLPGTTNLSPNTMTMTLFSGILAVISVNIVIAFYIYMAIKEPSNKQEPDPAFVSKAKASVIQSTSRAEDSSASVKKRRDYYSSDRVKAYFAVYFSNVAVHLLLQKLIMPEFPCQCY
ncbi:hypothetical protein LWI29_035749 [Acer saccharum]|uniref:Vacuolar ATPase assembly integral membrane protein VMA21 homolog n=1 Tax=Acer saccharum TaxID=4024 RepID=A0AA39RTN1_ACESA|nr:hypothetical protein LWI29_035749 [Acer saccharum]